MAVGTLYQTTYQGAHNAQDTFLSTELFNCSEFGEDASVQEASLLLFIKILPVLRKILTETSLDNE